MGVTDVIGDQTRPCVGVKYSSVPWSPGTVFSRGLPPTGSTWSATTRGTPRLLRSTKRSAARLRLRSPLLYGGFTVEPLARANLSAIATAYGLLALPRRLPHRRALRD